MRPVDVLLLNPPFFRFWGSHNDRVPLTLCYLSRLLEDASISHVVYNADFTGAQTFWSMRWMFQNFETFKDAVDNKGSLYGEILEVVMSYSPKTVVIMAGEPLFPTKDWGNPFIAANFAARFKSFGIHTLGIGPFFTLDKNHFEDCFDCILEGEPGEEIIDIVRKGTQGRVRSKPMSLSLLPNLERVYPKEQQADFVMTSFGCFNHCSFCLVQKLYHELGQQETRFVDLDVVLKDLAQRNTPSIYLTDLDFSATPVDRLSSMVRALDADGRRYSFTVESRVDTITRETVDLWAQMGIKRVKLGIEGGTDKLMKSFAKGTTVDQANKAIALLRSAGISAVAYLVVGGPASAEEYEQTRQYIRRLAPDFVVINVWSYDLRTDYRYDSHFSPASLAHWNVDLGEYFKHLELQQSINPTVGKMLDVMD